MSLTDNAKKHLGEVITVTWGTSRGAETYGYTATQEKIVAVFLCGCIGFAVTWGTLFTAAWLKGGE